MIELVDKLYNEHSLSIEEYLKLLDIDDTDYLYKKANELREKYYGKDIFIRGLIEISNICKNDCLYCGISKGNKNCKRYRLSSDEILKCCEKGFDIGFRTFVMQGGEDSFFSDKVMCDIIYKIKSKFPDCAVTLSLGEKNEESYKALKSAGADRYLLRHETIDKAHYEKLHPKYMSYDNRMKCLNILRELGYQVGCGFMVGSPYQTKEMLAREMKFIESFKPDMCGIGPFIPHKDTEFAGFDIGSARLTCTVISIMRLIYPQMLIPSTTALNSIEQTGREKGILAGANVIMPNLSPQRAKEKYTLYNNKAISGLESASELELLKEKMKNIGYNIVTHKGDICTSERN